MSTPIETLVTLRTLFIRGLIRDGFSVTYISFDTTAPVNWLRLCKSPFAEKDLRDYNDTGD